MPSDERAPYDQIAASFDTLRCAFHAKESRVLDLLLETAEAGATVLDFGCGTGRPLGVEIARRGYKLVGVDRSSEMLKLAATYVPSGTWIEADLVTVELVDQCAAALCWDAIFHIHRGHHRGVMEKLYSCLQPGGRMAISSGGSEDDISAFTDQMFDHTFFYDAYPKNEMIELVKDIGFEIVMAEILDEPDGDRNKGRLGIVAQKPIE